MTTPTRDRVREAREAMIRALAGVGGASWRALAEAVGESPYGNGATLKENSTRILNAFLAMERDALLDEARAMVAREAIANPDLYALPHSLAYVRLEAHNRALALADRRLASLTDKLTDDAAIRARKETTP